MVADIRVREEVGRVTACPEQSRMGARRRPNANKPSPLATFVRRAEDCPPYQRFVGRGQAGIASGCSRRISTECRLAAESHIRDLRDPTFSKRKSRAAQIIQRFRRFPRVFAAPKRIGLKSHIRLSGVVVKASSRKQPFAVAPIASQQQQLAVTL